MKIINLGVVNYGPQREGEETYAVQIIEDGKTAEDFPKNRIYSIGSPLIIVESDRKLN